jgi:hypothetical protein
MDNADLKKLLQERNITIIPKEAMRVRGFDMDTYRDLAKQTEKIDYDCDFHDGFCRGKAMGNSGCCHRCAGAFGYWYKEGNMIDEDTAEKMAEFYDETTGFLRDGVGCLLPRELRSPTCLYIYCSDEKMSGEEKALLLRLQYGAHWG